MILSRFLVTAIWLASAAVYAQNLSAIENVPPCPLHCLLESLSESPCSTLDIHCQCTNQELIQATAQCTLSNCSISDGVQLAKFQGQLCDLPNQTRQSVVRGWLICQISAVAVTFLLRMYSCWRIKGGLFVEDYLIILAVAMCVVMSSLVFVMVDNGFATHVYQIATDEKLANVTFFFWVVEISYVLTINTTKISLLCLFLRIFPYRKFRFACATMISLLVCFAIMWCLLLTFQCHPVSTNWDIHIAHRRCYNVQIYAYTGAGMSMFEDIVIMILPIPLLLKLQVSLRQKIGVLFLFSLGIFVIITSAVRIRSIYLFNNSSDPTWDNVDISIWTAFEISVAIICCNMPSIAGLIAHYRRIYFPGHVTEPESLRNLRKDGTNGTEGSGQSCPRIDSSPRTQPSPRFHQSDSHFLDEKRSPKHDFIDLERSSSTRNLTRNKKMKDEAEHDYNVDVEHHWPLSNSTTTTICSGPLDKRGEENNPSWPLPTRFASQPFPCAVDSAAHSQRRGFPLASRPVVKAGWPIDPDMELKSTKQSSFVERGAF